jgi:DNA-binding response OmpR family regulator
MRIVTMSLRVLIAEDEPSVLALIRLYLERHGYMIIAARDGNEALDLATAERPDLIILDIQMPYKTGVEVVIALRARAEFSRLPVIALTAHVRDFQPASLRKAGFDRIMTKPFELDDLVETVRDLLDAAA